MLHQLLKCLYLLVLNTLLSQGDPYVNKKKNQSAWQITSHFYPWCNFLGTHKPNNYQSFLNMKFTHTSYIMLSYEGSSKAHMEPTLTSTIDYQILERASVL